MNQPSRESIRRQVASAIAEDLGDGDVTAMLVDPALKARATLIVREPAVLCGSAWFDAAFAELDAGLETTWRYADGDRLEAGAVVCRVDGPLRALLSAERTALNFLQTLSGTATTTAACVAEVRDYPTRILDTRKTIPGLRQAQKYAVARGGGSNHRMGLYDAVLIKENHIAGAGSVAAAVAASRQANPELPIEIEVETLAQVNEALDSGAGRLLLDNFELADLRQAVERRDAHANRRTELEASGGIERDGLAAIAATGVDYISVGALTKHVRAIDFSLRVDSQQD